MSKLKLLALALGLGLASGMANAALPLFNGHGRRAMCISTTAGRYTLTVKRWF